MNEVVFDIINLVLSTGAFIYGATKLFHKGKPMYFQILICAVGCYTLQEFSSVINYLCDGFEEGIAISILGLMGCVMFILAANRGALDALVDEHDEKGRRARLLALVAPIVVLVSIVFAVIIWKDLVKPIVLIVVLVIMISIVPASYFSLKHLLLPKDSLGILECTKPCNIFSFLYLMIALVYCLSFGISSYAAGAISIFCTLCIVGLAVSAVKGAEKWII